MEKIKISSLDNQTLFDLLLSEKSYILFVDESGVSKENISTLNEILRNREDFFLNMSSDKDENNTKSEASPKLFRSFVKKSHTSIKDLMLSSIQKQITMSNIDLIARKP